jgi:hypothetical protein
VSGAWVANSTLVASSVVSGVECVPQSAIGSRDIFLSALKQTGTSLEATVTSQGNDTRCAYAGTVDGNAVRLTKGTCQADRIINVLCADGARRDLQFLTGALTATLTAPLAQGVGTQVSTWSVLRSATTTSIGTLSLTESFSWVFLGLPSSDYHTFTGTVFPGYADGTITIEGADVFCSPCGWFVH